ncbi:MAG: hypothetical protein Q9163_001664 [Psora crenata]
MATLNLSTNGPSISKSYQSIVNALPPSGAAAQSPTYGQWAVFSVSAPLANAFQQNAGGKESVLKVQSTGEGELIDLIEEFSDGRIQFAFAKVKDPNTSLPKSVLIGWCGEGVPERTKGYFTSHLATVSKTLHGYHVQVTARSERDLTPESIIKKVSDASGSKYTGDAAALNIAGKPPPVSSKPPFTPTQSSRLGGGFNPLASSRAHLAASKDTAVDEDGWGSDAPPVTRSQLEKVPSSYQPTKVNMQELSSDQNKRPNLNADPTSNAPEDSNVVKGGYQPVGKVDIAALRKQAQQEFDDRPTIVKGAYEPIGKVDIAAIRARAQPPSAGAGPPPSSTSPAASSAAEMKMSLPDRSAPFSTSERLTALPKPKVANRFGSSTGSFTGTKAPTPGGFGLESKTTPTPPPVGVGRAYADEGGKTPAQLWAEKKARERGLADASDFSPSSGASATPSPMANQNSEGAGWKSGYSGKSWAPVQTTRTGNSSGSISAQRTGQQEGEEADIPPQALTGVSAIRDKFRNGASIGAANAGNGGAPPSPPALDISNKPNAGRGIPMPGLPSRPSQPAEEIREAPKLPSPPPQPPRSPTPPTPPAVSGSPIRLAMPVGRGHNDRDVEGARDEQLSPPPAMPTRSLAQVVPTEDDLPEETTGHDPARGAGEATAITTFGEEAVEMANPSAERSGKRALVQYDYEKAEDNELELKEGELVTNIDMVDENWWMGQNPHGETGLFPSNYVELIEDDGNAKGHAPQESEPEPATGPVAGADGATATALYDYEAAEDNELSFPENAKIVGIEFPDDDWWSGEYAGKSGLFPANYVKLDE